MKIKEMELECTATVVYLIDLSVMMMTLAVMNTVKMIMVVNMSSILFCVHVSLAVWCQEDHV